MPLSSGYLTILLRLKSKIERYLSALLETGLKRYKGLFLYKDRYRSPVFFLRKQ